MAEKTNIAWTKSTFNPFIGCTEVGPGCDNCYARELDKRYRWGGAVHWGAGVPRYRTSAATWAEPLKWEKKAAAGDKPWRVFCASLADVFDNEVPSDWRMDLWKLIAATPNLSWLLVTKRIGNVKRMVPMDWHYGSRRFPNNVRLLITVCDQEEADRDIPKLLALPCKNGISYEPALGPVDWAPWLSLSYPNCTGFAQGEHMEIGYCGKCGGHVTDPIHVDPERRVEWLIVGGESTQGAGKARPFDLAWACSTVAQCKAAGVSCFVKQIGSRPVTGPGNSDYLIDRGRNEGPTKDRAGADPTEWPEDLRVQCFPD